MIDAILDGYRQTRTWVGRGEPAAVVIEALRAVPREAFVLSGSEADAYANRPLPIGHGQTISQPYIVALMVDLLNPTPDTVALEIGTGCGYAAAVLSRCVRHVYTVETVRSLAEDASERLRALGFDNVSVHWGDGYEGWSAHAPYDAIVVTAAAPSVPSALVAQLAVGGRMVVPIGPPGGEQELILVEKPADGRVTERSILSVAFVPMV